MTLACYYYSQAFRGFIEPHIFFASIRFMRYRITLPFFRLSSKESESPPSGRHHKELCHIPALDWYSLNTNDRMTLFHIQNLLRISWTLLCSNDWSTCILHAEYTNTLRKFSQSIKNVKRSLDYASVFLLHGMLLPWSCKNHLLFSYCGSKWIRTIDLLFVKQVL